MAVEIEVLDGGAFEGNDTNPFQLAYTGLSAYDFIVVCTPRYDGGSAVCTIDGIVIPSTANASNNEGIVAEMEVFVYAVEGGAASEVGYIELTQSAASINFGMNVYGIKGADSILATPYNDIPVTEFPADIPTGDGFARLLYASVRSNYTDMATTVAEITNWTATGPTPDRQVYAWKSPETDTADIVFFGSTSSTYMSMIELEITPTPTAEAPYLGWPLGGNVYAPTA